MSGRLVICMWVLVMAFASCKTTRETEVTPESTVSGNHLAQREREVAAERAAAKEAFDKIVQTRTQEAAPLVTDGGWMIWADRQHGNVFEGREVVVARPHQGDRYGREILAKCRKAELNSDALVLTDWPQVRFFGPDSLIQSKSRDAVVILKSDGSLAVRPVSFGESMPPKPTAQRIQ